MPRDPTEKLCEFCGDGPECAVCGRGRPEPATVAAPDPVGETIGRLAALGFVVRGWTRDGGEVVVCVAPVS